MYQKVTAGINSIAEQGGHHSTDCSTLRCSVIVVNVSGNLLQINVKSFKLEVSPSLSCSQDSQRTLYNQCRAKKTFSKSTAFRLTLNITYWIVKVDGLTT